MTDRIEDPMARESEPEFRFKTGDFDKLLLPVGMLEVGYRAYTSREEYKAAVRLDRMSRVAPAMVGTLHEATMTTVGRYQKAIVDRLLYRGYVIVGRLIWDDVDPCRRLETRQS
jgi:hypothetical protein